MEEEGVAAGRCLRVGEGDAVPRGPLRGPGGIQEIRVFGFVEENLEFTQNPAESF